MTELFPLPESLAGRYAPIRSLSQRALLLEGVDGARFVLKRAEADGEDLAAEYALLGQLHAALGDAAPTAVDYFEEDGFAYLLQEWIPGQTLEERRAEECDEAFCADVGRKLCALLEVLHGMTPPVIHRDVKPENIILTPDGRVCLIDYGIARRYTPDKGGDTRLMGTDGTAAPEQYGFAQTDARTDLYGLGMTLCRLLTGSYDRKVLAGAPVSHWLKRAVLKCTDFSPEKRYATAAALERALTPNKGRRWALPTLVLLAALVLLIFRPWQRAGESVPPPVAPPSPSVSIPPASVATGQADEVAFPSRGLERAVRAELERPEGSILYGDLGRVERLALVGEDTFTRDQTYECRAWSYLDGVSRHDYNSGDVTDISLLAHMPNLTELYLCDQKISDISPLADLPLTTLALNGNAIEDVSVLETMPGLRYLWLGNNPIRDPGPIANVKWPAYINLDWMRVDSLDFLRGSNVWEFSFMHLDVTDGDWSVLEELPSLHAAYTKGLPPAGVEALGHVAQLTRLQLFDCTVPDLADLSPLAALEDLAVSGLPSLEGVEGMASLRSLGLAGEPLENLTALTTLPALTDVWADGALADRLDALDRRTFAVRRSG